jgi:NAD(P)-dependent dehydrogenase (short-subunit alcohol dehydrogenase family)
MVPARRALIVGNSDGIGLALTRRLLAEGWTVVGLSRRPSPVQAAGYRHAVADVAAADYRAALQAVQTSEAPFDACVYCAGIGELFDPDNLAREADVLRVNLVGAIETASVILPPMIAAGRGHFVGLSSIGDGVSDTAPSYAASKAGLSSYLGGLTLALRSRGVHVTNVRFGVVDTKMAKYPVRPFMITAERAADVVVRCLDRPLRRRPARVTYPWRMGALVWVLDRLMSLRLWLTRG